MAPSNTVAAIKARAKRQERKELATQRKHGMELALAEGNASGLKVHTAQLVTKPADTRRSGTSKRQLEQAEEDLASDDAKKVRKKTRTLKQGQDVEVEVLKKSKHKKKDRARLPPKIDLDGDDVNTTEPTSGESYSKYHYIYLINLFYKGKQPNRKAVKVDVRKHRNRQAEADEEVEDDFELGPTIEDSDDNSSTEDSSKASDESESLDSEDDNSEHPSSQVLAREKPRWGNDKGKQKESLKHPKSPKPAKARKPSKTAIAAARTEKPNWVDFTASESEDVKPILEHKHLFSKNNFASEDDRQWSSQTHIVRAPGGAIAGKLRQRPMIQKVLNGGIEGLHLAMVFTNAFPTSKQTTIFIRNAFLVAASEPGYEHILARLKVDVNYNEVLESIPDKRIAGNRKDLCICVSKHLASNYNLSTATTPATIENLLTGFDYIYPAEDGDNKPYEHPIFLKVIKERYFTGNKSLGTSFPEHFVTSFPEMAPLYTRPEIPIAMLAITATAIHFHLTKFGSASLDTSHFTASAYADIYHKHIAFIEEIRMNKNGYHALMSEFYSAASGIKFSAFDLSDVRSRFNIDAY